MKKKAYGFVIRSEEISTDIYSMWIETDLAKDANPGQFVGVFTSDKSALLPRPISICEVDRDKTALRLVYRIAGEGTRQFSHYQAGRRVALLGVLGNGFPYEKAEGKHAVLMGGGIGIPPILELAKKLGGNGKESAPIAQKVSCIVGYRNSDTFLLEELQQYADVYVATEDGSLGTKGNVIDALENNKLNPDIIYACGPMPMLRGIKNWVEPKEIEAYISLEERMACGVGACLGCVCITKEVDHHSHVNNTRICTDGPVFDSREVMI